MPSSSTSELRYRIGCPAALIIAVIPVIAFHALAAPGASATSDLLALGAFFGMPFGVLALARVGDWLAWLSAIALTAGLWTYFFYSDPRSTDFVWGFSMMVAPVVIGLICVAIAGVRGRVAWAQEDSNQPD